MKRVDNLLLLDMVEKAGSPIGATFISDIIGASPATVGRAMKRLEEAGYLEIVSNKGRQLTDGGKEYLEKLRIASLQQKSAENIISSSRKNIIDTLKFRKLVEPYTASRACLNATDGQIEEIVLLNIEYHLELRKGNLGSYQDLQIHLRIANAADNETIYHILSLILTENNVYQMFSKISSLTKRAEITQHDDIVEALRERDSEKAAFAMERHLDRVMEGVALYSGILEM